MSTYGFARIFWSSCRESGGQLSLEQKNVLVNTEPTLKKKKKCSSHCKMESKISKSLDLGKA